MQNKEKGFDGTNKHLTKLYINNTDRFYKSFGVQSRVGGIGKHTGLMSQKPDQGFVGSSFITEIPHPAHIIIYVKGEK